MSLESPGPVQWNYAAGQSSADGAQNQNGPRCAPAPPSRLLPDISQSKLHKSDSLYISAEIPDEDRQRRIFAGRPPPGASITHKWNLRNLFITPESIPKWRSRYHEINDPGRVKKQRVINMERCAAWCSWRHFPSDHLLMLLTCMYISEVDKKLFELRCKSRKLAFVQLVSRHRQIHHEPSETPRLG